MFAMLQYVTIVLVCVLMVCGAPPQIATVTPAIDLTNGRLSASYGGFSGSAGLQGSLLGGPTGVLDAEAGGPAGMSVSARLGGSLGPGFNIFGQPGVGSAANPTAQGSAAMPNQIPLGYLQAANQLLGGTPNFGGSMLMPNNMNSAPNSAPAANRAGNANVPNGPQPSTFLDDINNIPISALRSVNDLLNGRIAG